jgi:hypothetical protein
MRGKWILVPLCALLAYAAAAQNPTGNVVTFNTTIDNV